MSDIASKTLRVLVVEDERRLRAVLLDMIPELGFDASGASSAEEAMSIMAENPHEILLLDLQLPGMSGMDFFEQVRQRWPGTQVVILTAFGDLEAARRAIHLDVVEFLNKPFHLCDIERAFDRARKRCLQAAGRLDGHSNSRPIDGNESSLTLAESERRLILTALQRHAGNRTAAAEELGISRRTLHYRLAEYKDRGWQVE
ncbi:MAG TPA: response regulator [Tepidisphaeraceae bacterium]|nr:response regulator [Tepidisphaeraceae bacterium]